MERNSEEKSDKYRVNLGVWQPKFGRSFAIWQFGRTFGFPKDENSGRREGIVWERREKQYLLTGDEDEACCRASAL